MSCHPTSPLLLCRYVTCMLLYHLGQELNRCLSGASFLACIVFLSVRVALALGACVAHPLCLFVCFALSAFGAYSLRYILNTFDIAGLGYIQGMMTATVHFRVSFPWEQSDMLVRQLQ
jgi:hypothetical protein